MDSIFSPEIFT
ncbi:unnamed protein product, partial [Rotaria sp. Silwood1]